MNSTGHRPLKNAQRAAGCWRLAVAATVLALAGSSCWAQMGGGMGGGRRGGTVSTADNRDRAAQNPAGGPVTVQQVADKLYSLRVQLLISSEQAPAWEAFYAATMALAEDSVLRGVAAADFQSAQQAIDWRIAQAQKRYMLMARVGETLRQLYPLLAPDQQRSADQSLMAVVPSVDRDLSAQRFAR